MTEPGPKSRPHLYGRRKGHRLSPARQRLIDTLLPRLRLDLDLPPARPLTALWPEPVRGVWLEIGFGAGEHLAWQARRNLDVGFIGVEPFINGVARLLSEIEAEDLRNIALYDGDARVLLDWLPEASLDRIFILFPDPWPKKRHHKRRLLSAPTFAALSRALAPGGELRVATDMAGYVRAILVAAAGQRDLAWAAKSPRDWRQRPPDWPPTRYEEKAREAGRPCHYLRFTKLASVALNAGETHVY